MAMLEVTSQDTQATGLSLSPSKPSVVHQFDRVYTFVHFPIEQQIENWDELFEKPNEKSYYDLMTLEIPPFCEPGYLRVKLEHTDQKLEYRFIPEAFGRSLTRKLNQLKEGSEIILEPDENLKSIMDIEPNILKVPDRRMSSEIEINLRTERNYIQNTVSSGMSGCLNIYSFTSMNKQDLLFSVQTQVMCFPFPVRHVLYDDQFYDQFYELEELGRQKAELRKRHEMRSKMRRKHPKNLDTDSTEHSLELETSEEDTRLKRLIEKVEASIKTSVEIDIYTLEQLQYLAHNFNEKRELLISKLNLTMDNSELAFRNMEAWPPIQCRELKLCKSNSIMLDILPIDYSFVKTLNISDLTHPIAIESFLETFLVHSKTLEKLELRNVTLHFRSLQSVENFSMALAQQSKNRRFNVRYYSTHVTIEGVERNANLMLLMALTCEYGNLQSMFNLVQEGHVYPVETSLKYVLLIFKQGGLEDIDIDQSLRGDSCESLLDFVQNWKLQETVKSVHCYKLNLVCSKKDCENCSSLMMLLTFCKKHKIVEEPMQLFEPENETASLFLGYDKYFNISHVCYVAEQFQGQQRKLDDSKDGKHLFFLKLNTLKVNLQQQQPNSLITDLLIPALNVIEKTGIQIKSLEVLLDGSEAEWSFIRIPPSKYEIKVTFSNNVKIRFPPDSIKAIVTIEVVNFSSDTSASMSEMTGSKSNHSNTILSIDQLGLDRFTKKVDLEVPFPRGQTPRLLFKASMSNEWNDVGQSNMVEKWYNCFKFSSVHTGTLLSLNVQDIDSDKVPNVVIQQNDEYLSDSIYLAIIAEPQSGSIVLDCVQNGTDEATKLKFHPLCEMMKIDTMEMEDDVTVKMPDYLLLLQEVFDDRKTAEPSTITLFHPKKNKSRKKFRVRSLDSSRGSVMTLEYQLHKTDGTNTKGYLSFNMPQTEIIFPLKTEGEGKLMLKGLISCAEQPCLLRITAYAPAADATTGDTTTAVRSKHHAGNFQTLSSHDVVVTVEINEEGDDPEFNLFCRFFDEWTEDRINHKSPAMFRVQKVPTDRIEGVYVEFSGDLELEKKKLVEVESQQAHNVMFNLAVKDSLERKGELKFLQKVSSSWEMQELCTFTLELNLFPKSQLKSFTNPCLDENTLTHKRRVEVATHSFKELFQLLARPLENYIQFAKIEIYLESSEIADVESISMLAEMVCEVDRLELQFDTFSPLAVHQLLTKFPRFEQLNLSFGGYILQPDNMQKKILLETFLPIPILPKNLKFLALSEILSPLSLDDLFKNLVTALESNDSPTIQKINFSNMKVNWKSPEEVLNFRENLKTYVNKICDFELVFDNTTISVPDVGTDANLLVFVLLTSETTFLNETRSLVDSDNFTLRCENNCGVLQRLSMRFKKSKMEHLEISGAIIAKSWETLAELCKVWRISEEVESLQVGNLLMGCHEGKLSSIWFVLSNLKHARKDDLKDSLSKTVFCLETMLAVKLFVHENGYSKSSDSGNGKKCELRLHVHCSDSRGDFLLTQKEFFSTLENLGVNFNKVTLTVDTDETGWAFIKLNLLGSIETEIEFSNKVKVTFPGKSTDKCRVVAIEDHPIPDKVIREVCKKLQTDEICHLSPVVFIDQEEDIPFLHPVCIEVPYSSTDERLFGKTMSTQALKKHTELEWQVIDEKSLSKLAHTIRYESKEFSFFATITQGIRGLLTFPYFYYSYFPHCVYVTILPLDSDHKPCNVVFDCIRATEAQLEKLKVQTPGLEIQKVGEMFVDDHIYAELRPNLRVDGFYHRNRAGQRLHFFCPEHVSNRQEYYMEKVDEARGPHGVVMYSHASAGVEVELFEKCYTVQRMMREVAAGANAFNQERVFEARPANNVNVDDQEAPPNYDEIYFARNEDLNPLDEAIPNDDYVSSLFNMIRVLAIVNSET